MAWIREIEIPDAKGKLKTLYDRITARTKSNVANILKVHSLQPDVLDAHLNLYERVMFGESGLSRTQREMIAVIVSRSNNCDY
jgi:alkylhydroperoxidase family enzyme